MSDGIQRALLQHANVRVVACVATDAARAAASSHQLKAGSSAMLSQGLLGGLLLAALQKGEQRVNLQIECDGPLRGMLVDASADGSVRGYVKNTTLEVVGEPGPFRWRPLLGNSGFISVLRDQNAGEFYRSSVALETMALAADLTRYCETSDQVPTRIAFITEPQVAAVLVQALPGTSATEVEMVTQGLDERLAAAVVAQGASPSVEGLVTALFSAGDEGLQLLERSSVEWRCSCSKARVLSALSLFSKEELAEMLKTDGRAVATCQFCGRVHQADATDLQALMQPS